MGGEEYVGAEAERVGDENEPVDRQEPEFYDEEEENVKVKLSQGRKIMLNGKSWKVIRLVGKGSYGTVYVICSGDNEIAALKTGLGSDLKWEAKLMQRCVNFPFCLKFRGSGHHYDERGTRFDYVVLDILNPMRGTLQDLVKRFPGKKVPVSWATRIAIMMLRGLYEMHYHGMLHRDIKPEVILNVGILPEPNGNVVVMLDFGMGRFYTDRHGAVRVPRSRPGQKGTPSFMSEKVVGSREYGRVDDLWSWFYTYVELMKGELTMPWDELGVVGDEPELEMDHITMKSSLFTADVFLKNLPEEVYAMRIHLQTLGYEDNPDYRVLFTLLYRVLQKCESADPTLSFDPAVINEGE